MTRVVLGSASAGRLRVLRRAGLDPLVVVVAKLANAKAIAVAAQLPLDVAADCIVLGCDSMLLHNDALRGKPVSAEAARQQWASMAGSTGRLLTGHALLRINEGVITDTDSETASTTVHFGTPTDDELTAYVASGEPIHVAGAFTLDGLGGWFVDGIEGDPSNVIGISLPLVQRMVRCAGVSITDLWGPSA